ncbi:transcriptional initiation protein Tat [Chitinophaga caeni]|uniref:Transcriptional initiation protein Tat n=1 Tax=Chitinophaga caeni TaxID=2029983 RepID=A0A291QS18_9BACT|nr:gluconate 2-dehydrogenase subunit 3 family protein [Chitinophaga caeni]ATL46682.1 transcriptional initiation protein Tat [Chitinophaga caeni]
MDRRDSLKSLVFGSLSVGAILTACGEGGKDAKHATAPMAPGYGRTPDEAKRDAALKEEVFFTAAEMKTITVLADIIIPKDDTSGSATDAGVPDFIEFIVKDQPSNKLPMRGGLRWLDVHCLKKHDKIFTDLPKEQQLAVVDEIAYPEKADPAVSQGVSFFNRMRNLTATGFFTTKMGIEDLGYQGNKPNEWDGVPADVLKQYNLAYDEKMLKEAVRMEDRGEIMKWD